MLTRIAFANVSSRALAFGLIATAGGLSSAQTAYAQDASPKPASTAGETESPQTVPSDALDDIIITARRKEENAQKVPIVVTAFSTKQLEEKAITAPTDLQFKVPSLTLTGAYGNLSGTYAIRGLNNGVSSYFAEVAGGPTNPGAPFFDLANVQVLNGPQGTLFGRSNTAGAVIITPNRPNLDVLSGQLRVIAGSYARNDVSGYVNIPVVKGELALRVAFNRERRDGYTKIVGGGDPLAENKNDSIRATLDWKPGNGRFTNQFTYNFYNVDETPLGFSLAAYNPNLGIFNLPKTLAAYQAAGGTPASFSATPTVAAALTTLTSACNGAVAAGISPSFNTCLDSRLQFLGTLAPTLAAELARSQSSRTGPLSTLGSIHYPFTEQFQQHIFVNKSQYDFGDLGFTTLTLKNIFGFQMRRGASNYAIDGIGARLEETFYTPSALGTANQSFGVATLQRGPWMKTITDEVQISGVAGNDLFSWTAGYYFQKDPYPHNLGGSPNLYRLDSGALSANYGFIAAVALYNGGAVQQQAGYGQGTLNLSGLTPFISGLHFTGGFRRSWDKSTVNFLAASGTGVGGMFVPGAASTTSTKSAGNNTELSLDAQIIPNLLLYVARRTGYRPGGVNNAVPVVGLTGYSPTYGPEHVKDYEAGIKYDFTAGDVRGRLNFGIFQSDYSDIQRNFRATVGPSIYIYMANVAAARIKGFEFAGTLAVGDFQIDGTYSYTDAKFTNWIGTDPLNLLAPGNAACLPSSPTTSCLLDLSPTPFNNAPKHIASATLKYSPQLGPNDGKLSISVTPSYRSFTYLSDNAYRYQQVYGPGVLPALSQPGIVRLDARIEWQSVLGSNFDLAVFGTNLTNRIYAIAAVSQLQSTSIGTAVKGYAPPRMFGLSLTYRFNQ